MTKDPSRLTDFNRFPEAEKGRLASVRTEKAVGETVNPPGAENCVRRRTPDAAIAGEPLRVTDSDHFPEVKGEPLASMRPENRKCEEAGRFVASTTVEMLRRPEGGMIESTKSDDHEPPTVSFKNWEWINVEIAKSGLMLNRSDFKGQVFPKSMERRRLPVVPTLAVTFNNADLTNPSDGVNGVTRQARVVNARSSLVSGCVSNALPDK
jgi:hypothetical protein